MTTVADGFYRFSLIDGDQSIIATLSNYEINSTTVTINDADVVNPIFYLIIQRQSRDSWNYSGNRSVPYSGLSDSATIARKMNFL